MGTHWWPSHHHRPSGEINDCEPLISSGDIDTAFRWLKPADVTLVTTVAERPVVLNTSRAPRRIPRRHIANLAPAIVVAALLLYATFFGAGPLPALVPAFNPTTGA